MLFSFSDTMEIWSYGKYNGAVESKGEANWEAPKQWDSESQSNKDVTGWGTAGTNNAQSTNLLSGYLKIGSSTLTITSMRYYVTNDEQYGHLSMALDQQALSKSSTMQQAFANFLGLTSVDQQETYTGNLLGTLFSYTQNKGIERVIIGSMTGCSLEIWINFTTKKAMLQCQASIVHQLEEGVYGDPSMDAYLTSEQVEFEKLIN